MGSKARVLTSKVILRLVLNEVKEHDEESRDGVSVIQVDLTTPRPFTELRLSAANVFRVTYGKLLLGQSQN